MSFVAGGLAFNFLGFLKDFHLWTPIYSLQGKYKRDMTTTIQNVYSLQVRYNGPKEEFVVYTRSSAGYKMI